MKEALVSIGGGAVLLFAVGAFALPAMLGERLDSTWIAICAIVSIPAAIIADLLTQRRKRRVGGRDA